MTLHFELGWAAAHLRSLRCQLLNCIDLGLDQQLNVWYHGLECGLDVHSSLTC